MESRQYAEHSLGYSWSRLRQALSLYPSKELFSDFANDRQCFLVAYFFYDEKDTTLRNAGAILRSLLYQILRGKRKLLQKYQLTMRRPNGAPPVTRSVQNVLCENGDIPILCLVDGLNECEEMSRQKFLEQLQNLFTTFDVGVPTPRTNSKC